MVLAASTAGAADAQTLTEVRLVASGDYLAPRFSPSGGQILVTGPRFRGLRLLDLARGAVRTVSDDPGAGVSPRFLGGDLVLYQAYRAGARRHIVAGPDRASRAATSAEIGEPIAIARDDRAFVRGPDGLLRKAASGDRFFAAEVAPGGAWVAFQGLATGILLLERATGRLVALGPGTAPAWSPDGRRLLFERTEDDGHEILGSELYLYDLARDRLVELTSTPDRIERRPSFAPDGRTIAFDDDRGNVYLGRVAEVD